MRISLFLPATFLALATGSSTTLGAQTAQDTTPSAASQAHHALKSTGRGIKSDLKTAGSKTHHVLKTTGRSAKEKLKHVTGDTMPKDPNHKPGGVNKVARNVSSTFKHAGRAAKSDLKSGSSQAHHTLKNTGRDIKTGLKRQPNDTTHS